MPICSYTMGAGCGRRSPIRRLQVLVAILTVACTSAASHQELGAERGATFGSVESTDGARVRFAYDYDRNALVDSRVAGNGLIALTRAGHLLRFSLPDLLFEREY